jgi:hypothetical protein
MINEAKLEEEKKTRANTKMNDDLLLLSSEAQSQFSFFFRISRWHLG